MSLQVAMMKVLSGHPNGCAALADLNADLAVLNAVPDWTSRMRRLAVRRPGLDIFSQGVVVRDSAGWTLTAADFQLLKRLEQPGTAEHSAEAVQLVSIPAIDGDGGRASHNGVNAYFRQCLIRRSRSNALRQR